MRPVYLGRPVNNSPEMERKWFRDALREIETASQETVETTVADAFSATNVTATRSMDTDVVTLPQLADYVATFINDLKARGTKRSS